MNYSAIAVLLSIPILLVACGGSGGSGEAAPKSNTAAVEPTAVPSLEPTPEPDYTPDQQRLQTPAATSDELYVAENFNFADTRIVHLQLQAFDDIGEPQGHTVLTISRVANDITSWDDQRLGDAELLLTGRTNDEGVFARTFETPGSVKKLLVELQTVGINNRALLSVSGVSPVYVRHQFATP